MSRNNASGGRQPGGRTAKAAQAGVSAEQAAAQAQAAERDAAETEKWLQHWSDLEWVELTGLRSGTNWYLQAGSDEATRYDWPASLRPPQVSPGRYRVKLKDGHVVAVASRSGKFQAARELPSAPPVPAPQPQRPPASARSADRHAPGPDEFINPYNFIGFGSEFPERGDGPGHATYATDRFCGQIPVTLTAVTPLLLMDQSRAAPHPNAQSKDKRIREPWEGHKVLPLRVGPDGAPILAASSLKGVLRSAFEAVTNSRMGVFDDTKRYAMREPANAALAKRAAIVVEHLGRRELCVFRQADVPTDLLSQVKQPVGQPRPNEPRPPGRHGNRLQPLRIVPAALLPIDQQGGFLPERRGKLRAQQVTDGAELNAWVHLVLHTGGTPYYAWVISTLAPDEGTLGAPPDDLNMRGQYQECGFTAKVRGVLHITGSHFRTRTTQKHDERMVILESLDGRIDLGAPDEFDLGPMTGPASGVLAENWDAVITAYGQASSENVPRDHQPGSYRKPDYPPRWRLEPGRTLFVAVSVGHGEPVGEEEVTGLSPALIGRAPFPSRPGELVPGELLPLSAAGATGAPSPADRVFGWVAGTHGYRGHLRIDPPSAERAGTGQWPIRTFAGTGFELAPLGSPKPTQFRFYVQTQDGSAKSASSGYVKGRRGLRGRKVYPHQHQYDDPTIWDPQNPQARGRWVDASGKHKQTHSITGWVQPGAQFGTILRFDNLSEYELGALLYLLTMGEGRTFKVGMGKPLGFGSFTMSANLDAAVVFDDEQVRARYQLATPQPMTAEALTELGVRFQQRTKDENPAVLADFQAAVDGFVGEVHYPWTTQEPQPTGYEWFVANERTGQTNAGRRLKLPEINDPGLPRDPSSGGQAEAGGAGGPGPGRGGPRNGATRRGR